MICSTVYHCRCRLRLLVATVGQYVRSYGFPLPRRYFLDDARTLEGCPQRPPGARVAS